MFLPRSWSSPHPISSWLQYNSSRYWYITWTLKTWLDLLQFTVPLSCQNPVNTAPTHPKLSWACRRPTTLTRTYSPHIVLKFRNALNTVIPTTYKLLQFSSPPISLRRHHHSATSIHSDMISILGLSSSISVTSKNHAAPQLWKKTFQLSPCSIITLLPFILMLES